MERTRNLPAWAEGNPHTYFQAAERYEGKNRVAFEEWKITLPQELSREQNLALTEDLIDMIAGNRMPCTYAFHEPPTLDGAKQQPHLHLLLSTRMNDGYVRAAETHFKLYQREQPQRGGAEKDPAFWHKGAVKAHRVMVSDILNVHLERNGLVARVHPDSLESRGIDRKPEPKLSPSESRAYRENGMITETMGQVLQIRDARAKQPPLEQNNARQYWEQRKAFLGITRDMSREEKVAHILRRRHGAVERVAERYRPWVARAPGRHKFQAPTRDLAQQLKRLTQQLGRDDHAARSGNLRIRLHDKEREQDHGLGL
jgi:hypothetical protein